MTSELHGTVVVLRPLTEDDLDAVLAILRQPEVEPWWHTWDTEKARREMLGDDETTVFTIRRDGDVVGVIQYWEETDLEYRHAGMDIAVHPRVFGTGVALDALRTVARHLFDERGHHRLVIDPNAANGRAIACYRKLGFRPVGVMRQYEQAAPGVWQDGLLMDMLREELS